MFLLYFQENLNKLKQKLKTINNLYLAGFWYNNMDDSIENALNISNEIYKNKR